MTSAATEEFDFLGPQSGDLEFWLRPEPSGAVLGQSLAPLWAQNPPFNISAPAGV